MKSGATSLEGKIPVNTGRALNKDSGWLVQALQRLRTTLHVDGVHAPARVACSKQILARVFDSSFSHLRGHSARFHTWHVAISKLMLGRSMSCSMLKSLKSVLFNSLCSMSPRPVWNRCVSVQQFHLKASSAGCWNTDMPSTSLNSIIPVERSDEP